MQEQIDIRTACELDEITSLDMSCFGRDDLLNLILQRSQVLFDMPKPGRVIKAWNQHDLAPITAAIDNLGVKIAHRAAGVIYAEYLVLEDLLKKINPKRIADIGCGYAFFDLFAASRLGADVVLIDLEENEHRHFGYQKEGAAYSSLNVARELLMRNGIEDGQIECVNPRDQSVEDLEPVDLIVSFLSCGFHYPVDSYLPMIDKTLVAGGSAIFDLRGRTAKEQVGKLEQFGTVTDIARMSKARRVLLHKSG